MGLQVVGAGGVSASQFNALTARVGVVEADNLNLVEHSVNTDGTSLSVDLSKSKTYKIAFDTAATLACDVSTTEAPTDEISVNFLDIVATADGLLTINGQTYLITDGVNYSIAIEDVAGTSTLQTNLPTNPVGDDYANLTGYVTSETKEISLAGQAHYVTSTTVTGVTGNDPTTADQHDPTNGNYVYRLVDSPSTYKLFSIHKATVTSLHLDTISYLRSAMIADLTSDDSTDVVDGINAYITAAVAAKRRLYVPAGTYYSSEAILPVSGLYLEMDENAIFRFPATVESEATKFGCGIFHQSTRGSEISLSSDASAEDTTVAVSSASGLAVDDMVLIGSAEALTENVSKPGEINFITAISGTTITLLTPLRDNYATADSAFLQVINPIEDVVIEGGVIKTVISSAPSFFLTGCRIDGGRNVRVSGTKFDNWHYSGLTFATCFHALAEDIYTVDIGWIDGIGSSGTAHAVDAHQGSEHCTYRNIKAFHTGKIFDVGGYSSRKGMCRNILVKDSFGYGMFRQLIGLHSNAYDVTFDNIIGDSIDGPHLRGGNITVRNLQCKIIGGEGLRYQPQGRAGFFKMHGGYLKGTMVTDPTSKGMLAIKGATASNLTETFTEVVIDHVSVETTNYKALYFEAEGDNPIENVRITGSLFKTDANDAPAVHIWAKSNDINRLTMQGNISYAPNYNDASIGAVHFEANSGDSINDAIHTGIAKSGSANKVTKDDNSGAGTIDLVEGDVQT